MDMQIAKQDALQATVQAVASQDTMAEAGRKILLRDFIQMLEHEEGSRAGEDIEHVHDMRVATRRMRSALRLLAPYYKAKVVREFRARLKKLADTLGAVRDLDVLIHDLERYGEAHSAEMQPTIALLDISRQAARADLHRLLDRSSYADFVHSYGRFLTTTGAGVRSQEAEAHTPTQLRHLLPAMIYEHLGVVRAYEAALEAAEPETLHALRIEFKRLRYLVTFFSEVLGNGVKDFITELKAIQDHLGRMQDIQVASEVLEDLMPELEDDASAALSAYLDALNSEEEDLRARFPAVWKRFNSAAIQKKLASALVAL
jgi:CHAD domain-containing protein